LVRANAELQAAEAIGEPTRIAQCRRRVESAERNVRAADARLKAAESESGKIRRKSSTRSPVFSLETRCGAVGNYNFVCGDIAEST